MSVTGTLTEDGLDFWGVIPVNSGSFESVVTDSPELPQRSPLLAAMAACHTLTMLNGILTGDPLDIKMFEATKWVSLQLLFLLILFYSQIVVIS